MTARATVGRAHAPEACGEFGTETRRDEDLQVAAQYLLFRTAEHPLGGATKQEDSPLRIDDDDCVNG